MLLCLAVAIVVAPVGYWVLANSSAFAVSGVSVSGGGSLVSAEVRQAAVGAIGRKSLLQVDASAVARAVEKLPYVRTASVDRSFPHTLSIRITTYRPAAAVRSGKAAYLVSSDGRVLSHDVAKNSTLPVIRVAARPRADAGPARPGRDDASRRSACSAPCRTRSSTASATSTRLELGDAGLVAVIGHGLQVRLGSSADIDLKLRVAVRVLRSMQSATRSGARRTSTSRRRPGRRSATNTQPRHESTECSLLTLRLTERVEAGTLGSRPFG